MIDFVDMGKLNGLIEDNKALAAEGWIQPSMVAELEAFREFVVNNGFPTRNR